MTLIRSLSYLWTFVFALSIPNGGGAQTLSGHVDLTSMSLVPAGPFDMGQVGVPDAEPVHAVHLDSFFIDTYEVSNADYLSFVEATGHEAPRPPSHSDTPVTGNPFFDDSYFVGQPDYPVVNVTWFDARAYCQWTGKRLPTEAEWEKAARGTDGRLWPWGDEAPDADGTYRGNWDPSPYPPGADLIDADGYAYPAPVDSYPQGISPYGVINLFGNVQEWCADLYGADYYLNSPASNPQGPEKPVTRWDPHVVKGAAGWSHGLRASPSQALGIAHRTSNVPEASSPALGFRCALSVEDAHTAVAPSSWGSVKRAVDPQSTRP